MHLVVRKSIMENKQRKPLVAAILAFVTPGLGQLYNGQLKKAVIFYLLMMVLSVMLAITGLQYHFYGLVTLLICGLSADLLVSAEAFWTARKIKEITLRSYNKWYLYVFIALLTGGIDYVTGDVVKKELLGIKAYTNPSGSMLPTLLVRDNIVVDLNYYRKRTPQKGDIVVFKYPEDPSREFIKRVIATENDVIESRDKAIYINGSTISEPYIQHVDKEIKANDKRDNFGPLSVPKGKVFVMGDNRDQSYDSRFWGYVDNTQIRGKVLYFYWSKQRDKIGRELK